MRHLKKLLADNAKDQKIYIMFFVATVAAFVSSMSFFINSILYHFNALINIGNIISTIEFWLFLIVEIILYIKAFKNVERTDRKICKNNKLIKLFYIDLIVFIVCFMALIISLIVNKSNETTFAMFLISICLYAFQMLFVLNSKMVKKLFS